MSEARDVSTPSSGEPAPGPAPASTPAPDTTPQSTDSAPSTGGSQPSPGSREAEHQNLLAAVKDVVKVAPDPIVGEPRPDDAPEPSEDGLPPPREGDPQPEVQPLQDPTDQELNTYKGDTRRRIEQLLAQRNEARQTSERYKGDADAFAQFKAYQTAHQLENDDINLLLDVGAALRRGDFQGFLEKVAPYIDVAQQAVGNLLPADLQEQVDNGQIPWETAREIGMSRINQARLATEANIYRNNADLMTRHDAARQVYSAVADWEAQTKARDPDWALKQDIVERFSQALVQTKGMPATPQQAVAYAQEAYEEATRVISRGKPQPNPTRPTPSGVHTTTGNGAAAPEPRTLMEAAILGLQRGHERMH